MSLTAPVLCGASADARAVDNMYVGHSEEDAKEFAKVTYHVKKPIEQEAEGSAEEDEEEEASGMVDKIRLRVYEFIRQLVYAESTRKLTRPRSLRIRHHARRQVDARCRCRSICRRIHLDRHAPRFVRPHWI